MVKYNLDTLNKLCKDNGIILYEEYSNKNVNRGTIIVAKCINCDELTEKTFRSLVVYKNFGCKKMC